MADIVYDYSDAPTIKRFSQSRLFMRGLMGPFGSGKSSGCVIELVKWGNRQPRTNGKARARFAVIRNTYRQLDDTTIKTVQDWLPPALFGTFHKTDNRYVIDRLAPDLEIELLFRALDRPEHVSNLLSLELTGAWVNEAREVPWAVIQALFGRVGRFPAVKDGGCVDAGVIADTNPPDDESWWYQLFEERKSETAELFRQPGGREPNAENTRHLPANYYANLIANNDPDFIRVYVDGQYGYVKEGRPVYPEYSDSLHCSDQADVVKGAKIIRGWDFGLTPACVFAHLLPGNRFVVFDELVSEDLGIDRFSDTVLMHSARYEGHEFEDWGDPAGDSRAQTDEKTCFEILRGKKILIQSGESDLQIRVESVRRGLTTLVGAKPMLQLHSRCKTLRKGFQGRYQYKKVKVTGTEERYQDKPDKNSYSHPHDALQHMAGKVLGSLVKSRESKPMKPIAYPQMGIA